MPIPPWLAAIGALTALDLAPDAKTGSDAEVSGHALGATPNQQQVDIDRMSGWDHTKYLWRHRPRWLGGEGMPDASAPAEPSHRGDQPTLRAQKSSYRRGGADAGRAGSTPRQQAQARPSWRVAPS